MFGRFIKTSKEIIKAVIFNLKTTLLFLVIYSVIAGLISGFVSSGLFKLALIFAGIDYLGNDTIGAFLLMPLNWALLVLWFFIMGCMLLFEAGGFVAIFKYSMEKKKITLGEAISWGLDSGKRALSFKNIGLIFYMLLLLPFLGLFEVSCNSPSISIPGFIMDYISANKFLFLLFLGAMIFLLFIAIKWCFSIQGFVLEKKNFKEASAESEILIKGHWIKTFITFLLNNVIFVFGAAAVFGIVAFIIAFVGIFTDSGFAGGNFLNNAYYAMLIIAIIYMFLLPVLNCSMLTVIHNMRRREEGFPEINLEKRKSMKKPQTVFIVVLCCVLGTITTVQWVTGTLAQGSILKRPEVGAHRGDSVRAPENTMPAFELAIEEGADWVELDVHQTKDGVIIVSHDDNLERISGVDKCVHELTYAQTQELEVGSWFSDKYKGLRLSTLEEVLKVCKNKVKVQIELKPTDYDNNLEQSVVDIIRNLQMENQCVIISLNSQALINTKKIAPDIITVYTMVVSDGDVEDIEYADWYSVEESNISAEFIERIHAKGKKCYVWTINDADDVQSLIDDGVDGIIGDDPVMLKNTLDGSNYDGGFGLLLRSFAE